MKRSDDRFDELEKRQQERSYQARMNSYNKPDSSKKQAERYTRMANDTDAVITAAGSKTFAAMRGAMLSLPKGAIFAVGVLVLGSLISLGTATPLIAAGAALLAVGKGVVDSYKRAEMNYSGRTGAQLGNKIAAEGGAKKRVPNDKTIQKAVKKARDESGKVELGDVQSVDHAQSTKMSFREKIRREQNAMRETQIG